MKPGRNDPCPCGSGRKYKVCCEDRQAPTATSRQPANTDHAIDKRPLLTLFSSGQYTRLEPQIDALIRHHPRSAFLWSLLGATLQALGKDGLPALRKACALAPDDCDMHNNLGAALQGCGRLDEAEATYRQAIALRPDNPRAGVNLGNLLASRGRWAQAEPLFRDALRRAPRLAEAQLGLGNTLAQLGRLDEAETCLRSALSNGESAEAFFCLGNVAWQRGSFAQAIGNYQSALRVLPGFIAAHNNLGSVYLQLGDNAAAVDCFQKALHVAPNYAEARGNLGLAFVAMNRWTDAEASLREALRITPERADLYGKLAHVLKETGRVDEATAAYRAQLAIDPAAAEARIALALIVLPAAPADAEEAQRAPERFRLGLEDVARWIDADAARLPAMGKAIAGQQPFLLAYRDGNHVDLLSRYGDLAAHCAAPAQASAPQGGERVRLLVISNQIRRHSVWDVVLRGLLANIDRERFEIIVYHTGSEADDETDFARSIVDSWRDRSMFPHFENLLAAIQADRPDAILYPEIGMDPYSFRLATQRLARLQMASWGHPVSSGLATIDLYLSGELLEPEGAQAHYRERLIRLPGTGCCTTALTIPPAPLENVGEQLTLTRGTRFVVAQRAFKFDPAYDAIYPQIAAAVGPCCFVVLADPVYPWASRIVAERLRKAFAQRGLDADDFLVEIPWLSSGQFVSLLDACDVFLDCPAFSGYTTAWQAAHRGLPIVTLEGRYLRQRLAAGLLRKIGRPETIAHSPDSYVATAARLAAHCADPTKKQALSQAIRVDAAQADGQIDVIRAFEQTVLSELAQRDASAR